jgi:hypothetical protein
MRTRLKAITANSRPELVAPDPDVSQLADALTGGVARRAVPGLDPEDGHS